MKVFLRGIAVPWICAVIGALAWTWPAGTGAADGPGKSRNLSPAEARELIRTHAGDPGFVLLDVRTPGEFGEGRIEGAKLLDYRSPSFQEEASRLDRNRKYLVYCRTGNRSAGAVKVLEALGIGEVRHLEGGIVKWKQAGLPTVK
ncbi:MAG: rhodanese-like domain-containing protein [Deltaproteobacteria bacterium]|nr:rhodanese-like domain-containing protein [Deltaproteobacteria bacterium]